jgi:hypothetical protein
MININGQKGETIVEVFLSIAVLTAALGFAFAITNKSTLKTQDNHERYQAQLYANGQAELLRRDYSKAIEKPTFSRGSYTPGSQGVPNLCWPDCSGVNKVDNLYTINISRITGAGSIVSLPDQTYRIVVSWESIAGGKTNSTELIYGL